MTSPTTDLMSKMLDEIFDRDMANVFGTCTNAAANPGPTLTLDTILQSMERVRQIIEEPPIRIPGAPAGNNLGFGDIRIIETPAAVRRERVKKYPKRKGKTPAHWARMDKKWMKRCGFREVPCMYMLQANRDLHTPAAALVHPSHAALLRNLKSATPTLASVRPMK
jgi:hypothetical protein